VGYHEPVYFLITGEVQQVGQSSGWLGVVVVRHEHEGKSIWFRYAHLDPASITVKASDQVQPGERAGLIGAYPKVGVDSRAKLRYNVNAQPTKASM